MRIWDSESIQLFLLLFVPGFISLKIYDLLIPGERRDFMKAMPEAVSYSALNIAFFVPIHLLLPDEFASSHPIKNALFLFVVLLIAPICWPVLWVWLSKRSFISKFIPNPIPTSWDYIFGKREAFWVIVHLTDGRRIGGLYGAHSFSTTYPDEPQIYLEAVWNLNKDSIFSERVERSKGIVILGKEISSIEFFGNEEMQNE